MRISDWSSDVCSSDLAWIQEARSSHDGIILNAGAYSHTSIAILDALTTAELPLIEVHLTNIFRREAFRHHSYVSLVANGVICGLGAQGSLLSLEAMGRLIASKEEGRTEASRVGKARGSQCKERGLAKHQQKK